MKIFKFVLIFMASLALGFFLFTAFTSPNLDFERKVFIPAQKAEIWEVISDTSYYPKWKSDAVSIVGAEGEMGAPGFTLDLELTRENQTMVIEEQWTKIDSLEKIEMKLKAKKVFEENRTVTLRDSADGVILEVKRALELKNWMVKIYKSGLEMALPQETESELKAIKKLVQERGPSQL